MDTVKFGRTWKIETKADYDNAIKTLDGNDFCAEMCDDFSVWEKEKAEIRRQRAEVVRQARLGGLL